MNRTNYRPAPGLGELFHSPKALAQAQSTVCDAYAMAAMNTMNRLPSIEAKYGTTLTEAERDDIVIKAANRRASAELSRELARLRKIEHPAAKRQRQAEMAAAINAALANEEEGGADDPRP